MKTHTLCLALAVLVPVALHAAPKLRLTTATVGPVNVPPGAVAAAQTLYAYNTGDGSLALSVNADREWYSAALQSNVACPSDSGRQCTPIRLTFQTASLSRGTYTGTLTVADPNAVDAPQTVSVTVQVGGEVPAELSYYLPASGGSGTSSFTTSSSLTTQVATQGGGNWLSIASDALGSTASSFTYEIKATVPSGSGAGKYEGTVTTSGSSFSDDNRQIPVTLNVTSDPIANLATERVRLRIASGAVSTFGDVYYSNAGMGDLQVSGVTVSTEDGGQWLEAAHFADYKLVRVTVNPADLQPGVYQGEVTVECNAANGPLKIPVEAEVVAQGPPFAYFEGTVASEIWVGGEALGRGIIASVFGEQFTLGDAKAAEGTLATELNGTRVLVNGVAAPMWFASYGQINFQIPYDAPLGDAVVQVERDGQPGNKVGITIADRSPRLLPRIDGYGIVINLSDGTYAMPTSYTARGYPSHPAKAGDVLVIYSTGFGQTEPAVQTGEIVPLDYFYVMPQPRVTLGGNNPFIPALTFDPVFAGLTPSLVGLYQVNFQVPSNVPKGNAVSLKVSMPGYISNTVKIAIE